jgi:two-component system NarL family response regulator
MSVQRILVVDDHHAVRQSLVTLLWEVFPSTCIGEAHNGREALDVVAACPPDLVLMDAVMPHVDGIKATREIKARWPQVRVLVLVLDLWQRDRALDAGADAWLLKGCSSAELLGTLRALTQEPTRIGADPEALSECGRECL